MFAHYVMAAVLLFSLLFMFTGIYFYSNNLNAIHVAKQMAGMECYPKGKLALYACNLCFFNDTASSWAYKIENVTTGYGDGRTT